MGSKIYCERCGKIFHAEEEYRDHRCDLHYESTEKGECTDYLLATD